MNDAVVPDDAVVRMLYEFLDVAAAADRLVGRGRAAWEDDEFLRLAGETVIHRLGEVVARLDREDPGLVAAHPEVSWREMKAMRNLVAHRYEVVDSDIVWTALSVDLPREAAAVGAIVRDVN